MTELRHFRIVVIPGDGIGPEIVGVTLDVLQALQDTLGGFRLEFEEHEAGAGLYRREGHNIAPATLEAIEQADATLKGPVGLPDVRLPDGTEAGLLGGVLRLGLDVYANVRPIRLLPSVAAPLKLAPGQVDYVIVRENTEGLYLSRGKGVGNEQAMSDTMLVTRQGTRRVVRYAFELARRRQGAPADGRKRVTCVDKSNVLASYAFFRRVYDEVAADYPDVERDYLYADAAAQALVLDPGRFDVLVMENFLGDLFSDLGGGSIGGIGLCPAGNIGDEHAYFEPVHGSAPDIAGQNRASPISQVLSAALMLDHLGEAAAASVLRRAVEETLASGALRLNPRGQPVDGTRAAGAALLQAVSKLAADAGASALS